MPQPDPIQGFGGLPEWAEPYKIPETLKALYDALVTRGIPRFPTRAAADTAMPGAVAGQVIWSDADNAVYVRQGNAWRIVWPTPDTGWTGLSLAPGFTGFCEYRVVGTNAEMRFDVTGSVTADALLTSGSTAAAHRPTRQEIVHGSAYLDPAGARPTGSTYLSGGAGTLRATAGGGPAITRTRGRITWMVG